MQVALCIPVLERIEAQTDICIEALREFTHSKDIETIYIQRSGLKQIHDARNELVDQALSVPEVTHLFFIDSDMTFHFNTLYRWLCVEKDIVGAYYVGRGVPSVPWIAKQVMPFPYCWLYDEVSDRFKTVIEPGGGIQKIKGGFGFGLVLIRREVFEIFFRVRKDRRCLSRLFGGFRSKAKENFSDELSSISSKNSLNNAYPIYLQY